MRSAIVSTIVLALCAGCGEPVVEMSLRLPVENTDFNTSCITAVDVYVYGEQYPDDFADRRFDCIEVQNQPTFADIKRAIAGKVDLPLPGSGLQAVEIDMRTGPCSLEDPTISNLIGNAASMYDGSESMTLPMKAVVNCTPTQIKVRAVNILDLVRTKDCAMSVLPEAMDDGVDVGTISPTLLDGPIFWSTLDGPALTAGGATMSARATVGADSCLAASIGTESVWAVSCAVPGATMCAQPGEIEFGVFPMDTVYPSLDQQKLASYHGVIVGSVWSLANMPRTPQVGAIVDFDKDEGEIAYVESNGSALIPTAGATATGPSGMFVLYTNTIDQITIRTSRGNRTVKVASGSGFPAVVLVAI